MMVDLSRPLKGGTYKILDAMADGIAIVDQKRNITYVNKALCGLYGITKAECIGKNCYFLVERGYVDHSFSELVFNTKKAITYEQVNKRGKTFISTAMPVVDSQGQIFCVLEQVRSLETLKFYAPDFVANNINKEGADEKLQQATHKTAILAEFKSIAMQNLYKLADNMAPKNINMLILGESGTGKSHLAKRIHENSARKSGPFVTINCAAIPEALIESELFGYLKGAFSGASNKGKQGLVDTANNGTLFLDEIGELPLGLQAKLLQFVQEKTYTPVGGVRPLYADTRIIAATNREVTELVNQGAFREDLYYRLATVTLILPPLKERPEDIRVLLNHFCNEFSLMHETNTRFSTDTIEILCEYSWPGNIREMEHLVEFLILSCQTGYITPNMLPSNIYESASNIKKIKTVTEFLKEEKQIEEYDKLESLEEYIEKYECKLIQSLYAQYNTSYKLSERLKISQSTANRLIRKYIKNKEK